MKTEHIREYVSLAGTKNYSKTAEQFFISQPTLSKHIAAIESEIGCNLINHNSHGFELTEFGLFSLDEFVSLLESYQNIMKRAEQMKDGVRGTLVTGMLYYQANKWIRPVIQRFQTNYPEVHVKTVSGQPDQLFYGVSDGSMDAAFLFYNSSFMKLDRKKYQFLTVFQEPVIALFSPDSSLNNPARKITMEQLSGHRFLRNENGAFMNDFNNCFESYLKKNQIINT
ncbi:MAG: LysR family transcriptional regulator [Eubacterium sp.]|jgi:DNA-binding transcriptional LysR family regulator